MRQKTLLLAFFVLVGFVVQAQQKITGTVTSSEDGLPIPGASVFVKGNQMVGTATNIDGEYTLSVPEEATSLVFTFVGMQEQEVLIEGKTTIDVTLEPAALEMDEVVVVAYGIAKKSTFTGSASAVKSERIDEVPVTSFEKALSGNVPGLQVSNVSGQPGAASEVRIRGIGSFSADQNPLYVIDGVPVTTSSTGISYSGEEGAVTTPLSTLNPADIASITVLKDAAAASLYGSRAANGVIVITTKSGKAGETKFRFSTSHGISDMATGNYEPVSGEEFTMLMSEGLMNNATDLLGLTGQDAQDYVDDNMNNYYPVPQNGYTNWDDELLRKGQMHNYEISANGGGEKTTFFASIGANQTEGIAKNSDMDRLTGRVNLDHKASEKLSFSTNLNFSSVNQNIALGGLYYANPFYASRQILLPTDAVRNPDGTLTKESRFGYYNMVREYDLNERTAETFRTGINTSAEYEFFTGLKFKSTFAYDFINTDNLIYSSPISRSGEANKGEVYKSLIQNKRLTSSNILTYDKTFSEKHHINMLAGYEIEQDVLSGNTAEGYNIPVGLQVLNATSKPNYVGGYEDESHMLSYFGKVDYDFKGRYYISGSIRRDGSSRLGSDVRWANFWSLSASWRVTEESFMQSFNWLDDMKIRASYGTNGTLPTSWFGYMAYYSVNKYGGQPAINYSNIANPNLSWEESHNFNIGTEFRILKRFNGSFEYFVKNTEDMLMQRELSRVTGFTSIWENIGEMQNKGWEFTLNADIIRNQDFQWNASVNFAHYKNEITKLVGGKDMFDFPYIRREGEAYNTFYLRDWAGVNPDNGDALWYMIDTDTGDRMKDADGNFVKTNDPTQAAKTIVGCADPDLTGGFYTGLSYKGLEFNAQFSFSVGGDIYNTASFSMESDGNDPAANIMETQLDRWQEPGDNAENPKRYWNASTNSNWNSSRRVLSNDYLRLKNITLAYNLPKSLTEKASLSNVRVYFSGTNILTFASQDVVDPEQPIHGSTTWEIPNTKVYTVGLNINF